jgi:hypothetical protein
LRPLASQSSALVWRFYIEYFRQPVGRISKHNPPLLNEESVKAGGLRLRLTRPTRKSKARRGGRARASSLAWRRASRRSAFQKNLFQNRKCFRHSREAVSCPFLTCAIAGFPCSVMRGLDPRIHDERPHKKSYGRNRGGSLGLPGQARQ